MDASPVARWARISREVLRANDPINVHEAAFRETYADWDASTLGPPPAWLPGADARRTSNLGRLLDRLGLPTPAAFHRWSIDDRAGFWDLMARELGIVFDRPCEAVVDLSGGPERPRWFPGGRLNIVRSALQAPGDSPAVVQHGESGERRSVTVHELARLSHRVANGLVRAGLKPGDAVGLLLPMTIEAVAATIGIIAAGCVVVGVSESFAPPEIELRLRLGKAKLVITQEAVHRRGSTLPLYEKLAGIDAPPAVVIDAASLRPGDQAWSSFLDAPEHFDPVSCDPDSHINILFSSGTTGEPKAIPWTQTTPIKAAADAYLLHDLQPGDVVAWPTSPGWMMGPWLVFATLINRGTIALYDGHPGSEGFCRFVEKAGVNLLGLVPSLVSAWKAHDWPAACDWSRIKAFSSTGECSNPTDMFWLMARAGYRPVIEYCGGTEVGGGYITSTVLQPNAPACFNAIAFGVDLTIRDEDGRPADLGEGYLIGPSIGLSTELLNRDHHETYFAGCPDEATDHLRRHGDRIERLPGGYYRVLGRVDDTMNLGGIKVSAVEIEAVWNRCPDVADSAAVTATVPGGGPDRLVGYIVPRRPGLSPDDLRRALQDRLSAELNPLFRLSEVVLVETLPRTASNKMMRRLLRKPSETAP